MKAKVVCKVASIWKRTLLCSYITEHFDLNSISTLFAHMYVQLIVNAKRECFKTTHHMATCLSAISGSLEE
jgi:hypothetical protein